MPPRIGATAVAVTTVLAAGLVASTGAAAASVKAVKDNVAPYAQHDRLVGHANSSKTIAVSINLSPSHMSELRSTIAGLYRPGSSTYHQWLTRKEFHAAYSPSSSTVDAVKSWFKSNGLSVSDVSANHLRIDATGSIAKVEKAFGVTENVYRYKGHKLRANAQAPKVPAGWADQVTFVGGLDQMSELLKPEARSPKTNPGYGYSTPGPCTHDFSNPVTGHASPHFSDRGMTWPNPLTWTPCGYTPKQVRAAYGLGAPSTNDTAGAGATIGVVDAFVSPTLKADANQFFDNHHLPKFSSSNFQIISHPGTVNTGENIMDPQGWYGEESLDVEWAHTMAPGANIIYSGANNSEVPLDHALADLIDSNKADVITNSWGFNGEPSQYGFVKPEEMSFMQAAAQGESILFSSGDDGDVANPTDVDLGVAQASYPASSPWVTAVGGTSLLANKNGGSQQYGWGTFDSQLLDANGQPANNSSDNSTDVSGDSWSPLAYHYGSGGGTSLHFTMDSFPGGDYQAGVVPNELATTTRDDQGNVIQLNGTHRVVPDISMVGDPNTGALYGETYIKSGDPLTDQGCTASSFGSSYEYCERRIGGTSLSSPLFSGVVAQAVVANGARLGLLNPALYSSYAAEKTSGAVSDILPPTGAVGVLRNFQTSFSANEDSTLETDFRPTNEGPVLPSSDSITLGSGGNSLFTARNYDNLTGLGTVGDVDTFAASLAGP